MTPFTGNQFKSARHSKEEKVGWAVPCFATFLLFKVPNIQHNESS